LVLLAILLLQTIILWIIAYQRASFSKPVRLASVSIESMIFIIYLAAVMIETSDIEADFTFYLIIIVCSAVLSYTINMICSNFHAKIFIDAHESLKNLGR
jgi:ABC-type proline/glycine betaine transport system substrate-binding protein